MFAHGAGSTTPSLDASTCTLEEQEARREWEAQKPLSERLKAHGGAGGGGDTLDLIPAQLLRRYIAYARKYVHPKITPECAQVRTCSCRHNVSRSCCM